MKHIILAECTKDGVTLHWSDGTTTNEHEHPTLHHYPISHTVSHRRNHNALRFRPAKAQVCGAGQSFGGGR